MGARRYIPVGILLACAVALQMTLSACDAAYYLTQVTMSLYYAIVAVGLSLLMGYAGQVSLGHAGFFAIGGYTAAFLATKNLSAHAGSGVVKALGAAGMLLQREDLYGQTITYLSPWAALAAAVLLTAAVACLVGIPVIRLKGHYLAMATLGFGIIVYYVALGTPGLGEADGFSDVPPFRLGFGVEVNGRSAFRVENFYIAAALAAGAMALGVNLVRSRAGRALRAIHEGEEAAQSLGVHVARYKFGVFMLSALIAAVAGFFMTHYNGGIGPSEATAMKSVRYVAIVAVGGMANLWGALIMGVVLNFLSLRGAFGSFDDAVFGLILIGIMALAPGGVFRMPGWLKRKGEER
jgi:branched-chain amino acid transport system permease protein